MGLPLKRGRRRLFSGVGSRSTTIARKNPEDWLQICFAQWLDAQGLLYTASCAGMRTHLKIAARMKAMGAKKGFPDIFIYEPNKYYCGLALELKAKKGKVYPEQRAWSDSLNEKGFFSLIMPTGLDHDDGLEWLIKQVKDYMKVRKR